MCKWIKFDAENSQKSVIILFNQPIKYLFPAQYSFERHLYVFMKGIPSGSILGPTSFFTFYYQRIAPIISTNW